MNIINITGLILWFAGFGVLIFAELGGMEYKTANTMTMILWAFPAGAFAGRTIAEMMNGHD